MTNLGPNTQECLFAELTGAQPHQHSWIRRWTSDVSMTPLVPKNVWFVFCTKTPGRRVKQEEKFNLGLD